ncbi:hypothetical protein [Adoxophyes orana nucleopolyhedrovirus]|uniref:hypothetical protein n=1 Tax=Adoxophyes orana nucleopolyhedrovirus TaxID=542343 RepID=UPI0001829BFA|nr:hypothetical protein [Adoxophyes orana nucleopolyhedrovirus]ACF05334.1 hypothetical protein [Adoxophyes orana nucleopolyhedrovirus]
MNDQPENTKHHDYDTLPIPVPVINVNNEIDDLKQSRKKKRIQIMQVDNLIPNMLPTINFLQVKSTTILNAVTVLKAICYDQDLYNYFTTGTSRQLEYKAFLETYKTQVKKSNYRHLIKMLYLLYNYWIDNVNTLVYVMVNVNYSNKRSDAVSLIANFINNDISLRMSRYTDQITLPLQVNYNTVELLKLNNKIKSNQKHLTDKFNSIMLELHNVLFYKFTICTDKSTKNTSTVPKENKLVKIQLSVEDQNYIVFDCKPDTDEEEEEDEDEEMEM